MGRSRRQRLGQSFLVDRGVARRVAGLLEPDPARVVEIGPGRGALTEPLLERFDAVRAVELDESLLPRLEERLEGTSVELRTADALKVDLDELLGDTAPWQLASNLPYSVGTAILRRLLPRHDLVTRMVVMLQREVAQRVVARPGDREHGLLALERAARAEAFLAFTVPPSAFRPRPKVTSAVVVLDLRPATVPEPLLARALSVAASALTRPRKMLANALPEGTAPFLEAAGIDSARRPGTLSLDEWVRLAERVG